MCILHIYSHVHFIIWPPFIRGHCLHFGPYPVNLKQEYMLIFLAGYQEIMFASQHFEKGWQYGIYMEYEIAKYCDGHQNKNFLGHCWILSSIKSCRTQLYQNTGVRTWITVNYALWKQMNDTCMMSQLVWDETINKK